jgi:predicted ATPase
MRTTRRAATSKGGPDLFVGGFIKSVNLKKDRVESFDKYPYSIPAIKHLELLPLDEKVTFLIGENGSGKSTLIEAIAVLAGFNAEGGTKNYDFSTKNTHSKLYCDLQVVRGVRRERDGYFLRAESYFNVATEIERLDEGGGGAPIISYYGGKSLHEQSHGESFLALIKHRFREESLLILDEPEAALSPLRQLTLLKRMNELTQSGCQFIIATHSPIIMAFPSATIYQLDAQGIAPIAYEETEHFRITLDFLRSQDSFFRHLFTEE